MPFSIFRSHTWTVPDTGAAGTQWELPICGKGQRWSVTIAGQLSTAKILLARWNSRTELFGDWQELAAIPAVTGTVSIVCSEDTKYAVACDNPNETIEWQVAPAGEISGSSEQASGGNLYFESASPDSDGNLTLKGDDVETKIPYIP